MSIRAAETTVKLATANTTRPSVISSGKTFSTIVSAVIGILQASTRALQVSMITRHLSQATLESPVTIQQVFAADARHAKSTKSPMRAVRGISISVVSGAIWTGLVGTFAGNATAQNIIDSTHGSGAGSFELGGPFTPTGFDFMRFQTGSTTISGWTVGGASGVDWLRNSGHRAAAGTYSLDLKGTVAGAFGEISTTIPTNPGCVYRLRFKAYGGGISISNSGLVSAASLINAPFQPPGQSPPVAVYQDYQFAFTALATTTTIRFRSDVSSDSFGPIIDDVIVTVLGCNPVVVTQPSSGSACPADSAVFTVSIAGSGPFNYQWQWQPAGTGTAWAALSNGLNTSNQGTPAFDVTGATTAAVGVRSIWGLGGNLRCIVTNPWGSVTSNEATLTILDPSDPTCTSCSPCAADYNSDGGVDGADVDAFFIEWVQAATCADVNQDGGVDGSDVDTFFTTWVAGGC